MISNIFFSTQHTACYTPPIAALYQYLACSMVSFRYLHKKYELQPGMGRPGLSVPCCTASAIFMKNWAIYMRGTI